MIKKQIPNLFTLLNLLSGIVAVVYVLADNLLIGSLFVLLGIFFDFFDGFFARLFQVEGEFGKQLDSLADMVTSGVVPGFVMFQLLHQVINQQYFSELSCEVGNWGSEISSFNNMLPYLAFIIPLASAFRLAKFNIDERQTNSFIGLPTPALAIFVISLPLILHYSDFTFVQDLILNKIFLITTILIGSYLLNSEMQLFALKFKTFHFSENKLKYLFLFISIILLFFLKYIAVPIIILLYILISLLENINKN